MKRIIAALSILAMSVASASAITPTTPADSATVVARLKVLKAEKAKVDGQITEADKLRNRQMPNVDAETMEQINLDQDAKCLDLRSRRTSIELEIDELEALISPNVMIDQFRKQVQPEPQTKTEVIITTPVNNTKTKKSKKTRK